MELIFFLFLFLGKGVEEIEIDDKNHKVVVKGKNADPLDVLERVKKKCGKHVELISPILLKPKQPVEAKKEEKKQVSFTYTILVSSLPKTRNPYIYLVCNNLYI